MKQSEKIVLTSVATTVTGVVLGRIVNNAIDKKLAKSKNPGMVNRFLRWGIRVGNNPYYTAAVVAVNVIPALCVANQVRQYEK